jgi:hypothetical protein
VIEDTTKLYRRWWFFTTLAAFSDAHLQQLRLHQATRRVHARKWRHQIPQENLSIVPSGRREGRIPPQGAAPAANRTDLHGVRGNQADRGLHTDKVDADWRLRSLSRMSEQAGQRAVSLHTRDPRS